MNPILGFQVRVGGGRDAARPRGARAAGGAGQEQPRRRGEGGARAAHGLKRPGRWTMVEKQTKDCVGLFENQGCGFEQTNLVQTLNVGFI